MRKNSEKGALLKLKASAILYQLLGALVALPMGLMLIICSTMVGTTMDNGDTFPIGALILLACMTAAGIGLMVLGVKKDRMIQRFRRYALWFSSSGSDSVKGLSDAMGIPCDIVLHQLEQMLALGFFPEAFIDRKQQRLIFPDSLRKLGQIVHAVICPHCGATAEVPEGSAVRCEYCGCAISK